MSLLKFLLPLLFTILLHFQPIRTLESLSETWSSPNILSETSEACCIPTSITTKATAYQTVTATYQYKENNDKCLKLFGDQKTDRASLTLSAMGNDQNVYVVEQDLTTFNFKFDENSKLSIELTQYNTLDECKFTLTKDSNWIISLDLTEFYSWNQPTYRFGSVCAD